MAFTKTIYLCVCVLWKCTLCVCHLLLEQVLLDVLKHLCQPLLCLSLRQSDFLPRVSPHGHTLVLLHILGTHLQTDRHSLRENVWGWGGQLG